jgi:hypothetical protein
MSAWWSTRGLWRRARSAGGHDGALPLCHAPAAGAKAYARTAAYDAAISAWFAGHLGIEAPHGAASPANCGRACAMARTRISARASISRAKRARASRRRGRCRASSFPTTTSTTRMRPSSWFPNSIRPARLRWRSSSTPIPAAWPKPPPRRSLSQGARLRSGFGLRRHRRAQPAARRRGGPRDRGTVHRGHHRAGATRGSGRDRRRKKNLRLLVTGACPIRARAARWSSRSPAGCWCSRATMRWWTISI